MELLTETYFDEYKESFSGAEDREFVDENATSQDIQATTESCISVFIKALRNL